MRPVPPDSEVPSAPGAGVTMASPASSSWFTTGTLPMSMLA
jgi:hypothetical protein